MKKVSGLVVKSALATSLLALGTGGFSIAAAFGNTSPQTISDIAGTYNKGGYTGDGGPAVKATLNHPTSVAADLTGTLYISEHDNNTIRKVVMPTTDNQDIISTLVGNGHPGFKGDGGPANAAQLNQPLAVATDNQGNLFIADTGNRRVREVSSSGTINTIVGNGMCGDPNHIKMATTALSAPICQPAGLVADNSGNLYISDMQQQFVYKVNLSTGAFHIFAGNGMGGHNGDGGPATSAQLNHPMGLTLDSGGHLYIADSGNGAIREVSGGFITTFAGTNGHQGFMGDGGAANKAQLNQPSGIVFDPSGNAYINDTNNQRIRAVTGGIISTYARTGMSGGPSGDGGPALSAHLNHPTGELAFTGNALFFADHDNQEVRGVFTGPPPVLAEIDWAIILPLVGGGLLLVGFVVFRLRRRHTSVALPA